MSFTVRTSLPLYVSATGITIRITSPGSAVRLNGSSDDAMADDDDGLFIGTVDEDLVGIYTYTIYRSGTPIQSGWLKRIADQSSVLLDDARADLLDRTGNSAGQLAALIATQLSVQSLRRLDAQSRLATDVTVVRGTTWSIPLSVDDAPSDWSRIEFTARAGSDAQSASLLYIVLSDPGSESDGLQVLRGSIASDASQGQITIVDDLPIATVVAAAVADVADGEYCWDCKITTDDGVEQVNHGTLFVEKDVTRLSG